MKEYSKGILLGIFVTVSCVGFIASQSNSVGRYVPYNGDGKALYMLDTTNGMLYINTDIRDVLPIDENTGTQPYGRVWDEYILDANQSMELQKLAIKHQENISSK